MTAVHFDANGKGHFWPGFSECGAEKVKLTRQKGKVTCARCRKTAAFKDARMER